MRNSLPYGSLMTTYEDLTQAKEKSRNSSSVILGSSMGGSGYKTEVEPIKKTKDYLRDIQEQYDEQSNSQHAQHHRHFREKIKSGVVSHNNQYQQVKTITGSEDKVPQIFQKSKPVSNKKIQDQDLQYSRSSYSGGADQERFNINGPPQFIYGAHPNDSRKNPNKISNTSFAQVDNNMLKLLEKLQKEIDNALTSEGNILSKTCQNYLGKLYNVGQEALSTEQAHIILKNIQEMEILAMDSIDNITGSDSQVFNFYIRELQVITIKQLSQLDKGTYDQINDPASYQEQFLQNAAFHLNQLTENDPLYATVVKALYEQAIQLNLTPAEWDRFVSNYRN